MMMMMMLLQASAYKPAEERRWLTGWRWASQFDGPTLGAVRLPGLAVVPVPNPILGYVCECVSAAARAPLVSASEA